MKSSPSKIKRPRKVHGMTDQEYSRLVSFCDFVVSNFCEPRVRMKTRLKRLEKATEIALGRAPVEAW